MHYGILLAAGFGRRYAELSQGENKLLAPLAQSKVVAQSSAIALRSAVDEVIAVVRPNSHKLRSLLFEQDCYVLEANDAYQGMGASLAAAALYLQQLPDFCSDTDTIVIALADMPWIKPTTYTEIINALRYHSIVAPSFKGKRGHPVGFQASLVAEMTQLKADIGAKPIIAKHGVKLIEVRDSAVLQDIDTPTDLELRAHRYT